jgi:hypothetical protein
VPVFANATPAGKARAREFQRLSRVFDRSKRGFPEHAVERIYDVSLRR